MKSNFVKINGEWYFLTGKLTTVEGTFDEGPYDTAEAVNICSGDIVGIDDGIVLPSLGFSRSVRSGISKKSRRAARVDNMCGIHWNGGFKVVGKNRFLRRRMMPNQSQTALFNEYLPF